MAIPSKSMICDLNEGYAIYRPRYILPDYNVYIEKGCEFLELPVPKNLDEAFRWLIDFYIPMCHQLPHSQFTLVV